MADAKISQLPDGGQIQPSDQVPVNRAGTTMRATGAGVAVGAYAYITAGAVTINSFDTVPFDVTLFDTASFFDAGGHRFVIPAGKAGMYLAGFYLNVDSPDATRAGFDFNLNTAGDAGTNNQTPIQPYANIPGGFCVNGSQLLKLAVGDAISLDCFTDQATLDAQGGLGSGCVFWLSYMGAFA